MYEQLSPSLCDEAQSEAWLLYHRAIHHQRIHAKLYITGIGYVDEECWVRGYSRTNGELKLVLQDKNDVIFTAFVGVVALIMNVSNEGKVSLNASHQRPIRLIECEDAVVNRPTRAEGFGRF
jgi:hypothetical protein